MPTEEPLPHVNEPFPRYSYSFDVSRYMENLYPSIVVTPASVDGDQEERIGEW